MKTTFTPEPQRIHRCDEWVRLEAEVEAALQQFAELTPGQLDALRAKDNARPRRLHKGLGHVVGRKERAFGA